MCLWSRSSGLPRKGKCTRDEIMCTCMCPCTVSVCVHLHVWPTGGSQLLRHQCLETNRDSLLLFTTAFWPDKTKNMNKMPVIQFASFICLEQNSEQRGIFSGHWMKIVYLKTKKLSKRVRFARWTTFKLAVMLTFPTTGAGATPNASVRCFNYL